MPNAPSGGTAGSEFPPSALVAIGEALVLTSHPGNYLLASHSWVVPCSGRDADGDRVTRRWRLPCMMAAQQYRDRRRNPE